MKFQNLRIGNQLNTGFGIILVLILFLSVMAWEMMNQLARQTTDLYEHPHTVRGAIGALRSDVLLIQRGMKDLALVNSDEEKAGILQDIKVYEEDAKNQFAILYDRYLGPQSDIDSASANFVRWSSNREETVRLMHDGKAGQVIERTRLGGAGANQAERMLANVKSIDIFSSNKSNDFYQRATNLKNKLKYQLLFSVFFVLLLTLVIVNFLSRNIRTPLSALTDATIKFMSGNRKARSSYASGNEFGILSSSFNEMAETIETEWLIKEKSTDITNVLLAETEVHEFANSLLKKLLEHTGGQMGALFFLNPVKERFELFKSIGTEVKEEFSFPVSTHEGELGLAAATKKIQHITQISPDSLFTFSSFTGQFKPAEIITIPLITNNETIAILSLASIRPFYRESLSLLQTVFSALSARMDAILSYRKVVDFSKKLEHQNSELEVQKNELTSQASELTQQNIELAIQKKQVDEANHLKTAFLSNMSHELRTPLNSVIALSGVLSRRLKNKVPGEEYSYLEVIERNGKQLLELINDILDLSRIESGREEITISEFSVDQLVKEVVEVVEPTARQKKIFLKSALPGLPKMKSDFEKCRHILQNIVANAVKFTDTGGVEIKADTGDAFLRIFVKDTGIGIAKEFQSHIFEEFRQVESSTARKYGGTGLGLAIAKKYAGLLGGTIKVESILGKGSTFIIHLPLNAPAENEETLADLDNMRTDRDLPEDLQSTEEKTILIVEDTEAITIQLKDFLESRDYNILVAQNGKEALEIVANRIPDAMILDLMMPGVDGFEVLRRIRSEQKTAKIPVVVLTAKYITREEHAALIQDNVYQLIQKGNVNKEQLLKTIARMMRTREVPSKENSPVKNPPLSAEKKEALVLIVEDNADNMITLKALLDGKCRIIEANDGRTGIAMAEEQRPDLILMDIALPGVTGVEVLSELRKKPLLKATPVIAVTASAMKGEREELLHKGFSNYISKPIDFQTFNKIMDEFL